MLVSGSSIKILLWSDRPLGYYAYLKLLSDFGKF